MSNLELDLQPLLDKFKELEGNERIKAQRQASGKALKVIKDSVLNRMQNYGIPMDKPNKLYPDLTPRKGVRMSVYKDGSGGSVNVMSNYILIFLNQGTVDRSYTTKNGVSHRTGSIQSMDFLGQGLRAAQNNAINILNQEMDKAINDLWNKR